MEGQWENGSLKGQGRVIHADHILKTTFADGQPDLPATITYTSTSYTAQVDDKGLLGQRAVAVGGEE